MRDIKQLPNEPDYLFEKRKAAQRKAQKQTRQRRKGGRSSLWCVLDECG